MPSRSKLWNYDLVKNAATGAVLGLCASFVIPFMRPVKGAFIGALIIVCYGVFKNISQKSSAIRNLADEAGPRLDVVEELRKFSELRNSGAITNDEFEAKKKRLLEI